MQRRIDRSIFDDHRDPLSPLFLSALRKRSSRLTRPRTRTGKGAKRVLPCRGTRGRATTDANSVSKIVPGPFISSSELLSSKVVITGGRYLPGRNRLDRAAEAPFNFTTDHVSTIAAAAAASFEPHVSSDPLQYPSLLPPSLLAGGGLYLILFATIPPGGPPIGHKLPK